MAMVVLSPEPLRRTLRERPLHMTVVMALPTNPTGSLLPYAAQCDTHTCMHTHSHIRTHTVADVGCIALRGMQMLKQKASDDKQNLHTQMQTDYSVQCAVSTPRDRLLPLRYHYWAIPAC